MVFYSMSHISLTTLALIAGSGKSIVWFGVSIVSPHTGAYSLDQLRNHSEFNHPARC